MTHDDRHKIHKLRTCADLLEREPVESSGDQWLDRIIAEGVELAVTVLRDRAAALEAGQG